MTLAMGARPGPYEILSPLGWRISERRAAAMTGHSTKSQGGIEDLFVVWKTADPDLPILL